MDLNNIPRILLLFFLFLSTAGYVQAQQPSAQASAMFHDAPKTDGSQVYRPLGNIKWKFKTGGKIFSSPAVINGMAFIGSEDGNLYALDVQSGKQRWKFATGGAVHSSPAVYGNTVFFGSFDGYYYAVDIRHGKLRWKFKTEGEKQIGGKGYFGMKPADMEMNDLWDYFLSSPLIIPEGKEQTVYFGSSDGNLYAVNARNGSLKWKFKTGGILHTSPAFDSGTLFIGSWDTWFYAMDAKTGKEKWKFKTGGEPAMRGILSSATAEDGRVYFGARDANLYALNAENGNLVWKYPAENAWIISSPVVYGDAVYVGTSDTYLLLAIDKKTGREKFRFKTNGYVFGTPAIAGSMVYAGDFTGKMYAIDLGSAGKRWTAFSTEGRKQYAGAVLKNDTLDFGYAAKGADLYQYAENKKVMDAFYTLGSIVSSPAIQDGVLYFGSADGYFYALEVI
ncbi:MAG: PQQ-binding-like beta-propeller repeat protein [Chitinophagales bacterium]